MKSLLTISLTLLTCLHSWAATHLSDSLIRVASTMQGYNYSQPWEKTNTVKRNGLGAILSDQRILVTAELVTNTTFIELQTTDGIHSFPAEVAAIDYEANLALLRPATQIGTDVLKKLKPLELSAPVHLGQKVSIAQIEDNGMPLLSAGKLQGVDVVSSFIPGQFFLTYEIKASLQSSANSFTLPVLHQDKLVGLLTSYSSKDQIIDVIAPEIISIFLKDASDGKYTGFPSLGISTTSTTDQHFRAWLKLPADKGGLYISRVRPGSPADKAGIKDGDVLLSVDDQAIDRKGFYDANGYGKLFWSHLIRGVKTTDDSVKIELFRQGKPLQVTTTLARSPEGIIPSHTYDRAPRFLVKGGLIFQELSQSYLQAFGKEWESNAPVTLLDAFYHPEDYEKNRNRLVFLSSTIPTPATLGYENIRSVIIENVNGQDIKDIPSLIEAFKNPTDGIHTIKLSDAPNTIYLDASLCDSVDKMFLQRGLPSLSRDKE